MINPFLENPTDRRRHWKAMRESLTAELDDHTHLEITARWWSRAPLVKSWLDWDHPGSWPDPWELIALGHYDNSAIAIGMAYTLLLCKDMRWTQERVRLALACDQQQTMQHLIVVVDDVWCLNRSYAAVDQKDDAIVIQELYDYDGKSFRSVC